MSRIKWACACLCLFLAAALVVADPPDSAVSPVDGSIQIAHPTWSGTSRDIDFVIDSGAGEWPQVYNVTDNPLDDHRPRLAIASNGDAWVVWWRDDTVERVLVRKRHESDGSWDAERVLSGSESSRNPTLAYDGTSAWVAYESDAQPNRSVSVTIIIDDPDPIGVATTLGTSAYAGVLGVNISANQGHLWTTWIDSNTHVAWAEYDYASDTWALPSFESYAQDSIKDALGRIRGLVVD